jgi:hypothetical protein
MSIWRSSSTRRGRSWPLGRDSACRRLRPSRRAQARASREPARARDPLQRTRRPAQGGLRATAALAARRLARGTPRSTCDTGARSGCPACRARHCSSALNRGREADPAPGAPGVLAVHVGGLARRQARRAPAAASCECCDPPPLRRAVVRVQFSLPCSPRRRELPRAGRNRLAQRRRHRLLGRARDPRPGARLLAPTRRCPLRGEVAQVGNARFRPRNAARSRRLEPDSTKAHASRAPEQLGGAPIYAGAQPDD